MASHRRHALNSRGVVNGGKRIKAHLLRKIQSADVFPLLLSATWKKPYRSSRLHCVPVEDFEDIRSYFSIAEWSRLCPFMRGKKPGQVRVGSPEPSDSEEEELWTSGLTESLREGLEGRLWRDHSCSSETTPEEEQIGALQSRRRRGGNLRNVLKVNYQEQEVPKDDHYFFCDECRSFFVEECEVHGPIMFIADRPVAVGEPDRAKKTLPSGFEIRESGIPEAGLGVFYCGDGEIPIGTHFGPYEGHKTHEDQAEESGYSWVIYKSRHKDEYIDAKSETNSNWMRYVNCARNEEEQNLIAFQYKGGILYRSCRLVTSGEELLVWYGDEYARHLEIGFDRLWNNKSSAKGVESQPTPAQVFPCPECPYSFTAQIFLHKHMKRSHGDLYGRLLRSGEIKVETSLLPYVAASSQEPIRAAPGTVQKTGQIPVEEPDATVVISVGKPLVSLVI
ncbi:hypothetical protein NHX12_014496 [Muraenolepis orangiensis]|uniref:Histone-lysine N-methyltransferase PRDM9 n=1 Tax=Muraenolepis orangiensis TaxID=630683 RepID=A0A9Q0I5N7_9TELE|nr:hypothetical protein NHX12_014496 [Muraenolepis orangiensis]